MILVRISYLSRVLQHEDLQRELWKSGEVCFLIWLGVIRLFLLYEKLIELLFMIYVFAIYPSIENILRTKNKTKQTGDVEMKSGMEFSLEIVVGGSNKHIPQ